MKQALAKLAQFQRIDLRNVINVKRRHPLWNDEIHIEEELINLEESIHIQRVGADTLKQYPKIHEHVKKEHRIILKHCIGLVSRMLQKEQLPRDYTDADTLFALTRLIRIVVSESLLAGRKIDSEILTVIRPFLSLKQRLQLREWGSFSIHLHRRLLQYQLGKTYTVIRPGS